MQLLEIRQHRERNANRPSIAFGLLRVRRQFLGGLLGFANETRFAVRAEKIIRPARIRAPLDDHFAMRLNQPGTVGQIPAERGQEGIEKIRAELGLGVAGFPQFREAVAEGFHQPGEFFLKGFKTGGAGHGGKLSGGRVGARLLSVSRPPRRRVGVDAAAEVALAWTPKVAEADTLPPACAQPSARGGKLPPPRCGGPRALGLRRIVVGPSCRSAVTSFPRATGVRRSRRFTVRTSHRFRNRPDVPR